MSSPGQSSPITSRPPQVEFTRRFVQPPPELYVFRDDKLFIRAQSSQVSVELFIRARLLTPSGEIATLEYRHTTSGTIRLPTFEVFDLQEGFLIGVTVHTVPLFFTRGGVYALVGITRGPDETTAVAQVLAADYVEGLKGPTWPAGPVRSSVEGPGSRDAVILASPAAGANTGITVADNSRQRILGFRVRLVTDANAATRRVVVVATDGSLNRIAEFPAGDVQVASETVDYTFVAGGLDTQRRHNLVVTSLPDDLVLPGGFTFGTAALNLQAGDQFSQIALYTEGWVEE